MIRYSNEDKRKIGCQSELVVAIALKELKERGDIGGFYKQDGPGVDFFIKIKRKETIFFQVKSSFRHAWEHEKRYAGIPVVIVQNGYPKLTSRRRDRLVQSAKSQIRQLFLSQLS